MAEEKVEEMVKIRRKEGADIATCISYPVGERLEQWRPAPDQQEFEVSAVIAATAVSEGFFEVVPGSRSRLKTEKTKGTSKTDQEVKS